MASTSLIRQGAPEVLFWKPDGPQRTGRTKHYAARHYWEEHQPDYDNDTQEVTETAHSVTKRSGSHA